MAARTCAKRAHQLAASILTNGVGPSRLPAPSTCRCHLHTVPRIAAAPTSSLSAAPRNFSTSTYRLEDETPRPVQEESPSSAGKNAGKPEKKVGLFTEEVADAEPTLEYLDSLKPRVKRFQKQERRPKRVNVNPFAKATRGNPEDKQWERTKSRIAASFTRDQLATLARAAKLPGSYAKTVRKDDFVRRIMVHRFGMEDARERADRERREELEKRSVHISFRPAELYLLLARGSGKVRQEASKASVAILPQAPPQETDQGEATEKLGFWIKGKDQGIARMTTWVETFKQSIKTREEEVVLSSADATSTDAAAGEVLPPELVRLVSQLSRCFMEASAVQNGRVKLSLAYLDELDAQKAVLLLRQYQAESAAAMQRLGAAAYCDSVDTLRQYAMLPFIPNEPSSWIQQADDLLYGSTSDISFRVSHLPDLNAFSLLSTTKLPDMKLNGWSHDGELPDGEPFQALLDAASSLPDAAGTSAASEGAEIECSATLGHVLYSSGGLTLADETLSEAEVLARLADPLAPPRPGKWPIENVLNWTRSFRERFGRDASRFVPTTLFRSQKNVSLDIWLERQGYVLVGNGTAQAACEQMALVYQPADMQGRKLEVILDRAPVAEDSAADGKRGWQISEVRWVVKAEADMMVPEKSADLRLSAKQISPLEGEVLAAVEHGLGAFLSTKIAVVQPADATEDAAESNAEAEVEAEVEDVDAGAADLLGVETEVVDRPAEASANADTAEPVPTAASAASSTRALPPSRLTLPEVGVFELESARRMTVQTYQQRSSGVAAAQPDLDAVKPLSAAEALTEDGDAAPAPVPSESTDAVDASEGASEGSAPNTPVDDAVEDTKETNELQDSEGAEDAAANESSTPAPAADSVEVASPSLVREIAQDLVTTTTTESLHLVWRSPTQRAPAWPSAVSAISALVERHDMSIR